jgi:hypothetical protein
MNKKELATLTRWLEVVTTMNDEGEYHPMQEQGTYADGVADAIDLLLENETIESLNKK